jgi:hypothetical protein
MGLKPDTKALQVEIPLEGKEPNVAAEEVEPTAEEVEPTAEEVEPTAEEVEPTAEEVEPTPPVTPQTAVPLPMTFDVEPSNREVDRMLAAQGQLEDAAPFFQPGKDLPYVGVLLAIPLIVASGVLEEARATWKSIGPAFYGLRTTLVTMLLLALLRVKHPENLKEYSPQALGRILGLDRAPEVKTLRRKLARLADEELSESFLERMLKRRIQTNSEAMAFLYIDGHVRVYNGWIDLPKAHVSRLRLSLPATQDIWVNDAEGQPLMFVTQEAHPQLVGAMKPILKSLRGELGERRVTVVFDRGGWSPNLFRWMDKRGFDVITYRKGKSEAIPAEDFTFHVVQTPHGEVVYELHDTFVKVGKDYKMRQVTRRQKEHQTKIVTTRRDLDVTVVAQRMFARWRQENYFKYMREQYAIDALVEYGVDLANPTRLIPNPKRKVLDKEVRKMKDELTSLEARYGAAVMDDDGMSTTPQELQTEIQDARDKLNQSKADRKAVPPRVPIGKAKGEALCLPWLRKRLSDGMKMLAYQIETDLVRSVQAHYSRSLDEGRRLISAALRSAGDIDVVDKQILVTLGPQSSPHRTRALAELCSILNDTDTCFPGTDLHLLYAMREV